ncbi:hypothetical protein CTI12_AA028670 [Artemisia annua]|uniref:RNA-directed DNA polymerase, eukaryota, Reverse transcriptase zinc-binding domain protein n=1 Tax=Artemisia annua TaxID=35608 RepID=A0A2U1QHQ0_ARTAN|nr:hypothetical protein CTI12_AA028670 [Artemisia annua]
MAFLIGNGAASFPMRYPGVPVGCSMARCSNWNTITQSFASKLALWKVHGASISLWEDTWCGDHAFKSLFPCICMLDTDRHCMVKDRVPFRDLCFNLKRHPRGGIEFVQLSNLQARIEHVVLSEQGDSWRWTLNSAGFSIASARYLIDSKLLDTDPNVHAGFVTFRLKSIFLFGD